MGNWNRFWPPGSRVSIRKGRKSCVQRKKGSTVLHQMLYILVSFANHHRLYNYFFFATAMQKKTQKHSKICPRNMYAYNLSLQLERLLKVAAYRRGTKSSCLLILHLRRLLLLPCRRTECPLNLLHSSKVKPGAEEHHKEVEHAKGPKDPVVQPFMAVIDVEPSRKLVPICVLTEFTESIAAILYVAAGFGDEGGGIGLACLTRWRREASEFGRGTNDRAVVGCDGKQAFKEIVEGRQLIHPGAPKLE